MCGPVDENNLIFYAWAIRRKWLVYLRRLNRWES